MHFLQDCWFALVLGFPLIFTTTPANAGNLFLVDMLLSLLLLLVMDLFACLVGFLILFQILYISCKSTTSEAYKKE